jgi:hypothetical protein
MEAVVAAIDRKPASLSALTAAALLLPGLTAPPAQAADDDEFSFQYGRFQESERNLGAYLDPLSESGQSTKIVSKLQPITVDSLQAKSRLQLRDRVKFEANFIQDSWSGATPIATGPSSMGGNRLTQSGTTITGSSPFLSPGVDVYFDRHRKPFKTALASNAFEIVGKGADHPVHTLAMASPETRQEGNFKLGYQFDEAEISAHGGISSEPDYQSRFVGLGLKLDFDQKRTTLDIGANYSNAYTHALLNATLLSYAETSAFNKHKVTEHIAGVNAGESRTYLTGNREEWGGHLNLTQVVTPSSLFKAGVSYSHSAGYLENPYKFVTVFGLQPADACLLPAPGFTYCGTARSFLEQRPDNRNQLNLSSGWVQQIPWFDAALHLDYNFFHDDWGINAHTFSGDWVQPLGSGWSVTPRIRYYSQSAVDFYAPYLTLVGTERMPSNFSSDQRLSAYGALSGGVTLSKQLAKGLRLDAGFEYYTHKGSLNIGSGGEDGYADFNYYIANATLNVNLAQMGRGLSENGHSHHHAADHGAPLPAGVMFGHMLPAADDVMVGYRFMYSREDGDLLHGGQTVNDAQVIAHGCADHDVTCRTAPTYMNMQMQMLDIMYAPTDWLNLMLMPQFVNMDMDGRGLTGVTPAVTAMMDHLHGTHATGGVGDTGAYALFKLWNAGEHKLHLTVGGTAPSGDSAIEMNRMHQMDAGYIHYGMQLGSGTWDFKPSLTYSGKLDDWSWGAQVGGTKRLDSRNASGYALGDNLQASAWGGYSLTDWLAGTVRGIYSSQNAIQGRYKPLAGNDDHMNPLHISPDVNYKYGTVDQPGNYGGRYWDIGLGLNAVIPDGQFAGHHFSVEWLQPLMEDVNGYQLQRSGTLNATWSYMF